MKTLDIRCSNCGGVFHAFTECPDRHWISCVKFTVEVEVKAGVITRAAPIVRKFVGQPLVNLLSWADKIGGLKHEVLNQ